MHRYIIILFFGIIILAIALIKEPSARSTSNNEMISAYGYSFNTEGGKSLNRYGFFHIKGDRVRECYEKNARIHCNSWQRMN